MASYTITCDCQGDIMRAAVWRDKDIIDLYVDNIKHPDFSGAVLRGKVVRSATTKHAAWIECGLADKVYIEHTQHLKPGTFVTVRISHTAQGQGKAWKGVLLADAACPDHQDIGVVLPPPAPWQRAINALKPEDKALLRFTHKNNLDSFQALFPDTRLQAELTKDQRLNAPVDEKIEALLDPCVPLSGGSNLIIEQTQALVAIDVNSGETTHVLTVNLAAVKEAARQIRLRNLSGLIVIDCLKMKSRPDISKVINAFQRVAQEDPSAILHVGMSRLGLLECTRQRRGPSLSDIMKTGVKG